MTTPWLLAGRRWPLVMGRGPRILSAHPPIRMSASSLIRLRTEVLYVKSV